MSKIKILGAFLLTLLIIIFSVAIYFLLGDIPKTENPTFGVIFSQKHSRDLGLNWKSNYLAILNDLKVKELGSKKKANQMKFSISVVNAWNKNPEDNEPNIV